MKNYILKYIIFILLIIIFIFIILYSIFGLSISHLTPKKIKENRKLKQNLIEDIIINDLPAIYDKNNNVYYYNISDEFEGEKIIFKLKLKDNYKYKIIGYKSNLINIDYNKKIKIIIFDDKYYEEKVIQITNLPLINIITDYNITDNDVEAKINYVNNKNNININNNIKIHIRGATSKNLAKKSYKFEFYDKNFNKSKKINVPDFYYGSSFILDALYKDFSKIRNLLSIELWNKISDDFSNIDVNSKYVEIFINNEYQGLYLLTEPINRTKLNLDKSSNKNTSFIIKSTSWEILDNIPSKKIHDFYFKGYEIKYPNDEELYDEVWERILPSMTSYYKKATDNSIKNTFNIKNYIDLKIFNSFISNNDNRLIKNNYFYINNLNEKEIYIQPWDMEYTFALSFSYKNNYNSQKNLDLYDQDVVKLIDEDAKETNKKIFERYWQLRKSILTEQYMFSLIDKYKNELIKSAAKRDSELWYDYDIEKEINDIKQWIKKRIKFFDNYVKELENE